ncbi:MAG: TIGR01777 family protein [Armatimonadetes bacterium]|nr:TIGR01777 family protein [Armatimonadota bacterium]
MRILISGASGLVGTSLSNHLAERGHDVVPLGRGRGSAVSWDPEARRVDPLEGLDAVIHLAGENLASGRWTPAVKERILQSRAEGTRLIAEALARAKNPPSTLLSASAVGFYGNRRDALLTEESPPGDGFLSKVCQAWEAATEPASEAGIRVAHLRFGVVLSPNGGALARMLTPFRLGLGGPIGDGRQYLSWITLPDLARAVSHLLKDRDLRGAVNFTAPEPVTNADFTKALAEALHRPAIFRVPAFAARLALGEMGEELLLASQRAVPSVLAQTGFTFENQTIGEALKRLL